MAAYKDLVGQKITKVTSNPSEPKTGQMWYNSTDGKLRGLAISRSMVKCTTNEHCKRSLQVLLLEHKLQAYSFGGTNIQVYKKMFNRRI